MCTLYKLQIVRLLARRRPLYHPPPTTSEVDDRPWTFEVDCLRFIDSVERYEPGFRPDGTVADVFNALLEEARRQHPDDPIVAAVSPVAKGSSSGRSRVEAGALATAAQQLLTAVAESNDHPLAPFAKRILRTT